MLARLIAPAEFGAAVLALFLLTLALVIREQGVTVPLVQRRDVDQTHFAATAAMSVVAGLGLMLFALALVPLVWRPLFGPAAAQLALVATLAFPLGALAAVPQARLQRRLDFKLMSIAELAGLVTGSLTSIALALAGTGAMALVIGGLVSLGLTAFIVTARAGLVVPRWHVHAVRELAVVGAPAAFTVTTYTLFRTIDYFLIGGLRGTRDLGFYWRAYQLAVEYQSKLTMIMLRIAFPVYSRLDSLGMQKMRARIVRAHAVVLFPLLALLLVLAPVAVPFLYGERWQPAAELTQILCLAGFGMVLGTGLGPLMTALGRTRELMFHNLAALAVLVAAILVSARTSLTAVAFAVAVVQSLNAISGNYLLGSRVAGVPLRDVLADVAPAAVASLALVAVAYPAAEILASIGTPAVVQIAAVTPCAFVAYGLVLRRWFGSTWADLAVMRRALGLRF